MLDGFEKIKMFVVVSCRFHMPQKIWEVNEYYSYFVVLYSLVMYISATCTKYRVFASVLCPLLLTYLTTQFWSWSPFTLLRQPFTFLIDSIGHTFRRNCEILTLVALLQIIEGTQLATNILPQSHVTWTITKSWYPRKINNPMWYFIIMTCVLFQVLIN